MGMARTPWPVTSKDLDRRFRLLPSSDSSLFSSFLPASLCPRSQGPGEWLGQGPSAREAISPVLLDRLSSLAACCRPGQGGRREAGVSGERGSSLSLRECSDRLLRSFMGSSRCSRSDSSTLERRRAAFTAMFLVLLRISLRSAKSGHRRERARGDLAG